MTLSGRIFTELKQNPIFSPSFSYWEKIPKFDGQFLIPRYLHPTLVTALSSMGIDRLYNHQISALSSISEKKNVVIVTGTASGKSLCYQIPILNEHIETGQSTALLLFPTKALTYDQLYALNQLYNSVFPGLGETQFAAVYDGDTPAAARPSIRKKSHVLLTNPDMLNVALLPHHTNWATFFQNLKFVVIDELHQYRGIFGSHFCNIIRRLKRILEFYGAHPQFILTSATIGNPQELAERIIEEPFTLIEMDSSPKGERNIVLYNPPLTNPELGIREGLLTSTIKLGSFLFQQDVQTIVFCRSRRFVELFVKGLRQQFQNDTDRIRGYRSGYLKNERREIERGMKDRSITLVAATNALELGVDIGGVDAVLIAGYPGSVASFWQMTGRAGRHHTNALSMIIASMNPLDQYFARFPASLFSKPTENALIDPNNPLILLPHLKASAFEYPFDSLSEFGNIGSMDLMTYLDFLVEGNYLQKKQNKYFWLSESFPAGELSIRSTVSQNFILQTDEDGFRRTIGEVDYNSGLWMCHPGAVYLHDGNEYHVDSLDLEKQIAYLSKYSGSYNTEPIKTEEISVDEVKKEKENEDCIIKFGDVEITSQVTGFKKIESSTGEVLGIESLIMPSTTLNTHGFWITLTPGCVNKLKSENKWFGQSNDYGPDWGRIRENVLKRDDYYCQVCGKRANLIPSHVHHKIPFKAFTSPIYANSFDNLITLCPDCHRLAELNVKIRNCLSGLRYVMFNMAPLLVLCDSRDLGSFSDPHATFENLSPTVLIHDTVPGGIGLSESLFERFPLMIKKCFELVATCPCGSGCPSCVGPDFENGYGGKPETLFLLEILKNTIW